MVESTTNNWGLFRPLDNGSTRLVSVPKSGDQLGSVVAPTPGFMAAMSSEKLTSLIKIIVVVVRHRDEKTRTEVTGS